jgi:hypothetical protein
MDESVPSNGPRPDPRGKYDSIQGRQLCKKILAKYVTYDPHNYILDGVCPVIDGFNLLATTPTRSGKTGFFTLLMLVVREIAADKTLAIGNEVFPIDPVMIVVCPTKALEEDIVGLVITNHGMLLTLAKATQSREAGLTAIVINLDTVDLARKSKRNIWQEAIKGLTMVMVSLEELASRDFNQLLEVKEFWDRIFALGVDEVHLLYFWGALFQPNYRQIGYLRERLPMSCGRKTCLLAVTVTLREGAPMECICKFLSLHAGKYHFIRHSNARPDIQLIFRNMRSGLKSINFPELDWVLTDSQNIIIFCATIALGFRVACYLWRVAELLGFLNRGERIRMYNTFSEVRLE